MGRSVNKPAADGVFVCPCLAELIQPAPPFRKQRTMHCPLKHPGGCFLPLFAWEESGNRYGSMIICPILMVKRWRVYRLPAGKHCSGRATDNRGRGLCAPCTLHQGFHPWTHFHDFTGISFNRLVCVCSLGLRPTGAGASAAPVPCTRDFIPGPVFTILLKFLSIILCACDAWGMILCVPRAGGILPPAGCPASGKKKKRRRRKQAFSHGVFSFSPCPWKQKIFFASPGNCL